MFFFLKQWIKNPLKIGAIAPSSAHLAEKMVEALGVSSVESDFSVPCKRQRVCLELGPGTGAFTAKLIDYLPSEYHLILLERDPEFVKILKRKFPHLMVLSGDALELPMILKTLNISGVDLILSGLPLRSMPEKTVLSLGCIFKEILTPSGILAQFTYFPASPLPLVALKKMVPESPLSGELFAFVPCNFPPAFVWKYKKL